MLRILYLGESGKLAGEFLLEFQDILRPGYEPSGILDRGFNFGTVRDGLQA
jgi:hypothetical protein